METWPARAGAFRPLMAGPAREGSSGGQGKHSGAQGLWVKTQAAAAGGRGGRSLRKQPWLWAFHMGTETGVRVRRRVLLWKADDTKGSESDHFSKGTFLASQTQGWRWEGVEERRPQFSPNQSFLFENFLLSFLLNRVSKRSSWLLSAEHFFTDPAPLLSCLWQEYLSRRTVQTRMGENQNPTLLSESSAGQPQSLRGNGQGGPAPPGAR